MKKQKQLTHILRIPISPTNEKKTIKPIYEDGKVISLEMSKDIQKFLRMDKVYIYDGKDDY